jgi:hypothetical protein
LIYTDTNISPAHLQHSSLSIAITDTIGYIRPHRNLMPHVRVLIQAKVKAEYELMLSQ